MKKYSNKHLIKFIEESWKYCSSKYYEQYYEIEYNPDTNKFLICSLQNNRIKEIYDKTAVGDIVWNWKEREHLDGVLESSNFKRILDKIIDSNGNTYFIYERISIMVDNTKSYRKRGDFKMKKISKDYIVKKERVNKNLNKFMRVESLSFDELTVKDIEKFMDEYFKTINRSSFYNNVKILNELLNDNEINIFIDSKKYTDNYVNVPDEQILTLREVQNLCEKSINYQDKLIIYGLFKGIYGKNYSDLLNITKNDVAENCNYINLQSGKRFICDDFMKEILHGCIKEKSYKKYVTSNEIRSSYDFDLAEDSPYLIKPMPTPKNNFGRNAMSASALQRKFEKLSAAYKDETKEDVILTGTSLLKSGVLYDMFKQEIENGKDWSIEEIDKYLKMNGIKSNKNEIYRSYYQRYHGTNRNF